jgi:peptidyl-prolyl cis-trans isomerase SurA
MKKLLLSLATLALLLSMSTPALSAARENIAAVVNDSVITMTDIKDRISLYTSGSAKKLPPAQIKKMEQQVLDRLIDEALQLQEAKKLGIAVSEADVADGFADISRQNNLPPEDFKKKLIHAGINIHSLYDQIRADIAWSQVVRRQLRPQVNISESEINLTMNQIAGTTGKAQYNVAEIFLKVPDAAEEDRVRDAAEKIIGEIKEGANFAAAARQYSQAPGAAGGGELGWMQQGQLDPELDHALEKMQPGDISPPIRTTKGYHVILLKDLRRNSGDEEADQIVSLKQILIPVTQKDSKNVIAAKVARSKSLKGEIKSCKGMDAKMKDFPSPGTSDLGRGNLSALPQELRAIVRNLKIGELSPPIRHPSGILLLMVCNREEIPAAGPGGTETAAPAAGKKGEESRDKIASRLGMDRLDRMASQYLSDLRATAFIDKRL